MLTSFTNQHSCPDFLAPIRRWINGIDCRDRRFARRICRWIPSSCPFERDLAIFRFTVHIPALCKFNPFYPEIAGLRFRAIAFLADECGEDVTPYLT